MSSRLAKTVNIAFLILGLGLLVVLLIRLDLEQVWQKLLKVGWAFIPAFSAYVLGLVISTLVWKLAIGPAISKANFRDLLAAFWAGHAVNQVTPAASLGEFFKGSILRGKVAGDDLIASLITYNFMSTFVVQLFSFIGLTACLLFLDLPKEVMLVLFGVAAVFFIPVVLMYILLQIGAADRLFRIVSKLPFIKFKNPEILQKKARSVDRRIKDFKADRPSDFYLSILYLFSVRILQVAEVWIILLAIMPELGTVWLLLLALLTQTASQLVAWVATFVPGQVGIAEGGSLLLFSLLGLDPLMGFSMELVRRIRKVLGISIGLTIGFFPEL